MSDLLKSDLIANKIAAGIIVERRPPKITRGNGAVRAVRKVKLTPPIISPAPAAATFVSEIRTSFRDIPGRISFKAIMRFT